MLADLVVCADASILNKADSASVNPIAIDECKEKADPVKLHTKAVSGAALLESVWTIDAS